MTRLWVFGTNSAGLLHGGLPSLKGLYRVSDASGILIRDMATRSLQFEAMLPLKNLADI